MGLVISEEARLVISEEASVVKAAYRVYWRVRRAVCRTEGGDFVERFAVKHIAA